MIIITMIHNFRLSEMGQHVGVRILDVLFVRERGFKRETKLLNMLLFIKANVWKVCNNGSLNMLTILRNFDMPVMIYVQ